MGEERDRLGERLGGEEGRKTDGAEKLIKINDNKITNNI